MKKNILLSVFSGLLLWIAWPPAEFTTFLLFAGFVPMLIAIENIIRSDFNRKGKKIFGTAFLGFFIWNTLSIFWVYNALKSDGKLIAIPICLIPFSLGPLLMATACWLYYRLRLVTNRSWGLVGLVVFWIGYEYLHQTWDLAFPWMTLGNGFAITHQWIQWYEYTGVYGGTIWIWVVNILVFLIYIGLREAQSKPRRQKLIGAMVVVLVVPLSFSLYRYYGCHEQTNPSNIVVVQPNIDPYQKDSIPPETQINLLIKLSDSIAQPNTEFILWPETSIPAEVDEDGMRGSIYFSRMQNFLSKYKNGNLLVGAETYKMYNSKKTKTARAYDKTGKLFYDQFNTAINIENSPEVQFYHKSKLVPGPESLPFGDALKFLIPVFDHLGGATGSYGSQPEAGVFYSQSGIGVDPVICYESIWGGYVAESVKKGAQFIAIITNDGWWENTPGKDQHLDYAKLRAVETRRWVCRSANTGISAFINQRGDVVQHTKWWVKTAIKQNINLNSNLTFYVRHGDYLAKLGSLLAILGILFIGVKGIIRR